MVVTSVVHLEINRDLPDDSHHHRPKYARCLFAGIQHEEYNVHSYYLETLRCQKTTGSTVDSFNKYSTRGSIFRVDFVHVGNQNMS